MTDTIQAPVAKVQMLVRRPVAEVYAAFVDPTITAHFWFTRASGPLRPGAKVRWDWQMYGVSTNVVVKALEDNRRILIEWNGPEAPTSVGMDLRNAGNRADTRSNQELGVRREYG
jgi:uncharacterized protein YndB with AHSA1/START domain